MATINELARQRRQVFRLMLAELRLVDSGVERAQRFGKRVLARKRNIPSDTDLDRWIDLIRSLAQQLDSLSKAMDAGVKAWGVVR